MPKLRGEVKRQVRGWCETDYRKFWLNRAREPSCVIRINAGDAVPDFHMVAMRNGWTFAPPPAKRMRGEHRNVSIGTDKNRAGRPLATEFVALATARNQLLDAYRTGEYVVAMLSGAD